MPQEAHIEDERSPREIGLSSLAYARDYARSVADVTARVAEQLRSARIEEANELFAQVLDAIHVLVFTIDSSSGLLGAPEAESCPTARSDSELWIDRMIEAQEHQDWIRLADVLEYDVRRSLEEWSETIATIREVPTQ